MPNGALEIPLILPPVESAGRMLQPYFSLVIPTYNEGRNIVRMIETLSQLLDTALPSDYELLVVDDDSSDRTWEIAKGLSDRYPSGHAMQITLVSADRNASKDTFVNQTTRLH